MTTERLIVCKGYRGRGWEVRLDPSGRLWRKVRTKARGQLYVDASLGSRDAVAKLVALDWQAALAHAPKATALALVQQVVSLEISRYPIGDLDHATALALKDLAMDTLRTLAVEREGGPIRSNPMRERCAVHPERDLWVTTIWTADGVEREVEPCPCCALACLCCSGSRFYIHD